VRSDLSERALQLPADRRHARRQVTRRRPRLVRVGQQMRHHLGVGVAGHLDAGGLQIRAQTREVFDDPVVHHGDLPGRLGVRVRIAVRRAAVGGPTGVPDTGPTGQSMRARIQATLQIGQHTRFLGDAQTTQPVQDGDARGVVSAVFQATQPIHD
jgi:hypothetical protein